MVGGEQAARDWPVPPLGRVRAWAVAGVEPRRMGLGPVHAISRVLDQTGLSLEELELFEINEAFAVQVLACLEAARSARFARAELGRDLHDGAIQSIYAAGMGLAKARLLVRTQPEVSEKIIDSTRQAVAPRSF